METEQERRQRENDESVAREKKLYQERVAQGMREWEEEKKREAKKPQTIDPIIVLAQDMKTLKDEFEKLKKQVDFYSKYKDKINKRTHK